MTSMIPWFNKYTNMKQNIKLFPAKQKPNYCMSYFLTPKSRIELSFQSMKFQSPKFPNTWKQKFIRSKHFTCFGKQKIKLRLALENKSSTSNQPQVVTKQTNLDHPSYIPRNNHQ